jgi:hypothetical protein
MVFGAEAASVNTSGAGKVKHAINHLLKRHGPTFGPTTFECGRIKLAANELQMTLIFG